MGARDFQVLVKPLPGSVLQGSRISPKTIKDVEAVTAVLRRQFEPVQTDVKVRVVPESKEALVFETSKELFQILVLLNSEAEEVYFSLRFAYCNPESIYEPFCAMIEWLMANFNMYCSPMRPVVSENGSKLEKPYAITDKNRLRTILIPAMQQLRQNWQRGAGNKEAKLRPTEIRELSPTLREAELSMPAIFEKKSNDCLQTLG